MTPRAAGVDLGVAVLASRNGRKTVAQFFTRRAAEFTPWLLRRVAARARARLRSRVQAAAGAVDFADPGRVLLRRRQPPSRRARRGACRSPCGWKWINRPSAGRSSRKHGG